MITRITISTNKIRELIKYMSTDVICPYCGHQNKRQKEHDVDMQKYGKTCFSCNNCGMLFTLRDDGDGEFVSIRERITISTNKISEALRLGDIKNKS